MKGCGQINGTFRVFEGCSPMTKITLNVFLSMPVDIGEK